MDPHQLRALLGRALAELDAGIQHLTIHFPRPRLFRSNWGAMGKHVGEDDKSDLLASHLKCVRAVAALNSALVLLDHGQIQDVYALCRIADEQQEDVMFLSQALGEKGQPSKDQVRFVEEFYQEEFKDDLPLIGASQDRHRVPRQKIRAALARVPLNNLNPSDQNATTRLNANTMSGFVHGAYVHIMEQYDGQQYRTSPSLHPRRDECADILVNYVYRACAAGVAVAARCGDEGVGQRLLVAMDALAEGTDCDPSNEALKALQAEMKKRP